MKMRGVFAIPVTPFTPALDVDGKALERVVEFCLAAGAHGLVAPVNASEFSSLSDAERMTVAEIVTVVAAHHVPVVVGVSGVSAQHAAVFARHARTIGADAVIAMPPYVRKSTPDEIFEYFRLVAEAAQLPVFIQNGQLPVGTPMPAAFVSRLVQEIPGVEYLKEETALAGHVMTEELKLAGPRLKGVMGGLAGRFLLDEYARGSCGAMPACEIADVDVAIWNALEAGQTQQARSLFLRVLPLMDVEMNYGPPVCKEVLRRRGVIECTAVRQLGFPTLDEYDLRLLDTILADIGSLFTVAPLRG